MSKRVQGVPTKHEKSVKPVDMNHRPSKLRKRSILKQLKVARTTIQACGVLVLAIVTALIYNSIESYYSMPEGSQQMKLFLSSVCNDDAVYCDNALVPSRRTQKAIRKIPPGRTILEIPRHLQIWDLDALRDPFVRSELFRARMGSNNPLSPAAFLAAYLARLQQDQQERINLHPLLQEYLDVLPTYSDYAKYHPLLWSGQELAESFGKYSTTYDSIQCFRILIASEYAALSKASPAFANKIKIEQYQAARLSVVTRSFGTGPQNLEGELSFYKAAAGVDLSDGSYAMVPILDSYDHHPRAHVEFSYDFQKQCFVVSSIRSIPAGAEIFDSYGKRTDSDLFARYGFVNGDGSGWTQASFALWHKIIDEAVMDPEKKVQFYKQQRQLLLHYLKYDDGYDTCVDPSQADAWRLKKLKYLSLQKIANQSSRWVVMLSPRDNLAEPGIGSHAQTTMRPPSFDRKTLSFDAAMIASTCRLISLTNMDYDNNAEKILAENLANASFVLPPTQDALEFRTLMCIARMAMTAMSRLSADPGHGVDQQYARVARLNRDAFRSRNWTVAHLILGELQTLEVVKEAALSKLRPLASKMEAESGYSMREEPCPLEFTIQLLDEADKL